MPQKFESSTNIFEEGKEGELLLNKKMKLHMVRLTNEDLDIEKELKESYKKEPEREDIKTDPDGMKRFNGLLFVPKSLERRIIERHHNNITE